jgi:hypothetical protein
MPKGWCAWCHARADDATVRMRAVLDGTGKLLQHKGYGFKVGDVVVDANAVELLGRIRGMLASGALAGKQPRTTELLTIIREWAGAPEPDVMLVDPSKPVEDTSATGEGQAEKDEGDDEPEADAEEAEEAEGTEVPTTGRDATPRLEAIKGMAFDGEVEGANSTAKVSECKPGEVSRISRPFEHKDRLWTVLGGVHQGESSIWHAWRLTPRSEWTGETHGYHDQTFQKFSYIGLLVTWRNMQYVVDGTRLDVVITPKAATDAA